MTEEVEVSKLKSIFTIMKILKFVLLSVIILSLSAFALLGCASGDNKNNGNDKDKNEPIELPFVPA